MGLYTADGARKYLTAGEREAFLRAAERADRETRSLCMTLAYGGCRLSEALALTADRVDLTGGLLLFESLKKRRRGIHRAVPVPPSLLDALDLVHGIRKLRSRRGTGRGVRLWPLEPHDRAGRSARLSQGPVARFRGAGAAPRWRNPSTLDCSSNGSGGSVPARRFCTSG
jgi:integrase